MRKYEDRERVVRCECVELICDSCGRKAEHPGIEAWEWGGAGIASGTLEWQYTIDGERDADRIDLCYECAEAIANLIRTRQFNLKPQAVGQVAAKAAEEMW